MLSSPTQVVEKENSPSKVMSRSLVQSLVQILFKLRCFVKNTSKLSNFLKGKIVDSSKEKGVDPKNLFQLLEEIRKDF